MRFLCWSWLVMLLLVLCGCGQKTKVDPVSEEMKKAVEGSAARPVLSGGSDWEVEPRRNEYWVSLRITNHGEAGLVAVRVGLKVMVPYVGIGLNPSEPKYIEMEAGETVEEVFYGTCPGSIADKAIGFNVELYPASGDGDQTE